MFLFKFQIASTHGRAIVAKGNYDMSLFNHCSLCICIFNWKELTLHFYSLGFYHLLCDPVMHFLFAGSPHP